MGFSWGVELKGEKRYEPNRSPDPVDVQWVAPSPRDDGGMDLVPVSVAPGPESVSKHQL